MTRVGEWVGRQGERMNHVIVLRRVGRLGWIHGSLVCVVGEIRAAPRAGHRLAVQGLLRRGGVGAPRVLLCVLLLLLCVLLLLLCVLLLRVVHGKLAWA